MPRSQDTPHPPPTPETVLAMADQLRQYAEHFAPRDWNYTRDLGDLKHIRYRSDYTGHDRFDRRLKRALGHFVPKRERDEVFSALAPHGLRERLIYARAAIRKDDNHPDGVLDNGNILTHWEETGEYLQYVQPSIGSLIADWTEAEPENPYALQVAAEMKRINDAYGERLATEGTD